MAEHSTWWHVLCRRIQSSAQFCVQGVLLLLSKLFKARKREQACPDEYVYKLSRNDEAFRDHIQWFAFKIDNVLDEDLIQSSLSELLEIDHWRKLSGRIRLNREGRITLHVPKHCDAVSPAFAFEYQGYTIAISDHPVAGRFPSIGRLEHSKLYPNDDFLADFARTERAPKSLQEYIKTQSPAMFVMISVFTDATVVGLCWPHILMDGIGFSEFLNNWSLVLAGKQDKVTRVMDYDYDPMWESAGPTGLHHNDDWILGQHQLHGIILLKFQLRFVWNMLTGPPPERRLLVISEAAFGRLVQKTRLELKMWSEEQGQQQSPSISEGDILTGWMLTAANKHKKWHAARPIILGQALNLRPYLPDPSKLLPAGSQHKGVYTSNLVSAVYTFLPKGFLQHASVFQIALEQRKALKQQTTPGQVQGLLRHHRETFERVGKYQPMFGAHDSDLYFVTNAIKLQLQHMVDFSPAVVQKSGERRGEREPGSLISSFVSGFQRPDAVFPGLIVLRGKDQFGNVWINSALHRDCWNGVEDELQKL